MQINCLLHKNNCRVILWKIVPKWANKKKGKGQEHSDLIRSTGHYLHMGRNNPQVFWNPAC